MKSTRGVGQPGPKGWSGIGVRILATLFFLILVVTINRCTSPKSTLQQPTTVPPTQENASSWLRVEVHPNGASVVIDGLNSGTTPVSVQLPQGRHKVRVELQGYKTLEQNVTLRAGEQVVINGELGRLPIDTVPTSTATLTPQPQEKPPLPDLTISQVRIELETGYDCDYTSTQLGVHLLIENIGPVDAGPFVVEIDGNRQSVEGGLGAGQSVALWFAGYTQSGDNTIIIDPDSQIQESDKDNNTFSQRLPIPTLPPTCTPPPTLPPTNTPTDQPPPTGHCHFASNRHSHGPASTNSHCFPPAAISHT